MNKEALDNLWAIYRDFTAEALKEKIDATNVIQFLGWLEHREQIGASRYLNGVGDGYKQGFKVLSESIS